MKTNRAISLLVLTLSTLDPRPSSLFAQGTAFTYQGRLNDAGTPANGNYDLRFALFDAANIGTQHGSSLTNTATGLTNGLFTVTLDFGNQFPGASRWLEIGVRTNGIGAFAIIAPRQALTATPYALQAVNANTASNAITASSVAAINISGVLTTTQLPGTLVTNGASAVSLSGNFSGNGGGLTNLNAGSVTGVLATAQIPSLDASKITTGTLTDARLSANVPFLYGTNQFTGTNRFAGITFATNDANQIAGVFSGNASGLSNVPASQLSGTVSLAQLPSSLITNGASGVSFTGAFSGNGGGLTNLNAGSVTGVLAKAQIPSLDASNITTGTFLDVRLSANVAFLNGTNQFSGTNRFAGITIATNAANQIAGVFSGNASGLSNVPANQLTGTVALAQLPPSLVTNGATNVSISGTLSGNGAGLTGLNGTNITAGTISDLRLSQNVALRAGGNTFNGGIQTITNAGFYALNTYGGTVVMPFLPGYAAVTEYDGTNNTTGFRAFVGADGLGVFGATNQMFVGTYSDHPMGLFTHHVQRMTISAAGNVGIGTTSPAASLDLNGSLAIEGNNTLEFGAGIFGKEINAGKIGYETFTGDSLDIVGAGEDYTSRKIYFFAEGGSTFDGPVTATKFSGNGAGVTNVIIGAISAGGLFTWPGNFTLASSPGVGGGPWSVSTADVNGDGKTDLICVAGYANALTVLTNNGSGGFVQASSPLVGRTPVSVTAADVNGDGKPDLICANNGTNTLTVLTNDGGGGFAQASTLVVGAAPNSVIAVDVNGDGKVDLVSANVNNNTLTVLTNDGTGGFVVASTLGVGAGVGNSPWSVTTADVNGDGKPDLICANEFDNTLTVLTNNGGGGFAQASLPGVGHNPVSVTAADINGDGKPDLICANSTANTLTVLTNDGSGGFAQASSPGVGANPRSVIAVDINGDGKLDLICANSSTNTLTVLTNNGNGGFGLSATLGTGLGPYSVIAADVNGDGKPDLICANSGDNTLSVFWNTPMISGNFTGNFTGGGSALTSLNASQLITGTLADARLSTNVALLNASQTFRGANTLTNAANSFTGNGAGLTSLNASQLASGTVADIRLSTNVALRTGGNTFNGPQIITNGSVGIATIVPGKLLQVGNLNNPVDGMIRLSCGNTNGYNRTWDIGVPYGDTNTAGTNYSFVITDQIASAARFMINWVNGNVGIGVTNPAAKFHVLGSGFFGSDSNSLPASAGLGVRVFSDLTAGAGHLYAYNFGNSNAANLILQQPGGNVGIGTTNPANRLTVSTPTSTTGLEHTDGTRRLGTYLDPVTGCWIRSLTSDKLCLGVNTNGYAGITIIETNSGTGQYVGIYQLNPQYTLDVNGDIRVINAYKPGGGSWTATSDARLKKNVRTLSGALDKLLALRGVTFEYIDPEKIHELAGERMGLIAQEVEKVFPDWVETGKDGFKRVTVRGLEALVVEGLRQLREEQTRDLAAVKAGKDAEIQDLRARVDRLERLAQ